MKQMRSMPAQEKLGASSWPSAGSHFSKAPETAVPRSFHGAAPRSRIRSPDELGSLWLFLCRYPLLFQSLMLRKSSASTRFHSLTEIQRIFTIKKKKEKKKRGEQGKQSSLSGRSPYRGSCTPAAERPRHAPSQEPNAASQHPAATALTLL